MAGRRPWLGLMGIALLAVVLRCGAMVHFDALRLPAGENGAIARNVAQGNGFSFTQFGQFGPTSVRGPVYPMLLAAMDSLFGATPHAAPIAALTLNVLFAAGSCVMAFYLARPLLGERAGWIAAGLFAVWPSQIYAAVLLQGLCLAVLMTLIALRLAGGPRPAHAIFAGAAAAIALLCEPILSVPLFVLAVLIGRRRPAHALLMIAAAVALVMPWMLRNAVVHQQVVGITDTFWPDVYRGNGPDATGSEPLRLTRPDGKPLSQIDRLSPQRLDALKAQPEIGQVRLFRTWSLDWIRHNPLTYARLCIARVAKSLWADWDHPLAGRWSDLVLRSVGLFGLVGALLLPLPMGAKRLLLALALGLAAATMFSMAEARNAVLMDVPQLIGFCALLGRGRSGKLSA